VVDGLGVQVLGGDDLLANLLLDGLAELLSADSLAVLCRDDDSVDSQGDDSAAIVLVLHGDLGLSVRSEPGKGTIPAGVRHGLVELVGEQVAQGVHLGGLVGGVSEHETLVTSTEGLKSLLVVKTLGNIGGLLLNGNEKVASLVVEALVGRVVADVLDSVSYDLLVVQSGLGGDLAEDHDHSGLGGSLASNLGQRVLGKAGIENGIRDLVSDLIGVALADGLGLSTSQHRLRWKEKKKKGKTASRPAPENDAKDGPFSRGSIVDWIPPGNTETYGEQEGTLVVDGEGIAAESVGSARHGVGEEWEKREIGSEGW
jgi:hypothetical protein